MRSTLLPIPITDRWTVAGSAVTIATVFRHNQRAPWPIRSWTGNFSCRQALPDGRRAAQLGPAHAPTERYQQTEEPERRRRPCPASHCATHNRLGASIVPNVVVGQLLAPSRRRPQRLLRYLSGAKNVAMFNGLLGPYVRRAVRVEHSRIYLVGAYRQQYASSYHMAGCPANASICRSR